MNFLLRQYQTHRSQHNTPPVTPCGRREVSHHSSASLIGYVPVKGRERGREEREGQMKEEGQREDEREDGRSLKSRIY